MGCAPSGARYRRSHSGAWRYLLHDLKPDVAFVQEALFDAPFAQEFGQIYWSQDRGHDSGTAVVVRNGLAAEGLTLRSTGSYVAGAEITLSGVSTLFVSVHVGPPDYRGNLRTLADALTTIVGTRCFVIGGDLNAARHCDEVYGGQWFNRYFNDLARRHFHDCHWAQHGEEVQSFWGHQAREAYQCDHLFADEATARLVSECAVIDNADVRALSDHGPIFLDIGIAGVDR
jgi:hypothetical protein